MTRRVPRINVHVLSVFLVVGIPILAIGAFLAVGSGQAQLRQSYGQQLAQVAEHTAAGLDAYIYRRIIDAALLARVPDVREAVAAGNAVAFDRQAAERLGPAWLTPKTTPPRKEGDPAAVNPAARFFSEAVAADPLFRDIVATDAHGRVVAAFGGRSSLYVGDEAWWQEAHSDGQHGRAVVSDILWDKRTRSYYLEIATPIPSERGDVVAGVLRTILDAREMLAMVADTQLGSSGNAFLLREDGSVVYSRWPASSSQQFFAADLLREKLRATREAIQPVRLFLAARSDDGTGQMIGLARSQLGLSYPHLSWLVAVSQADAELFSPVRATGWNLLLVLALTAVGVLGFTLWDSRRLAAKPEIMEADLELVKHPRVHWIEEDEQEETEAEESDRPAVAQV
jgi:hypothetical protein